MTHTLKILIISINMISFCLYAKSFNPKKFNFKNGQILAISETNHDASTFFFEAATGSRYGHVGIVLKDASGFVNILESNPPKGTQIVALHNFLKRSINIYGEYQVTALEANPSLNNDQINEVILEAKILVKKKIPYNYSQRMNHESLNCSEFVYTAFYNAGIHGIGLIETKADLNLGSFSGFINEMWEKLAGPIPDDARFISPASIVYSKSTKILASNIEARKIISDFDIYNAWDRSGGLNGLSSLFEIQIDDLSNILLSKASHIPYK